MPQREKIDITAPSVSISPLTITIGRKRGEFRCQNLDDLQTCRVEYGMTYKPNGAVPIVWSYLNKMAESSLVLTWKEAWTNGGVILPSSASRPFEN